MNRVYKTKWSAAHQQYVVTDEHHATKGKAAKSTLAIAVGVSGFLCLGRLFQGQPNEAALCI